METVIERQKSSPNGAFDVAGMAKLDVIEAQITDLYIDFVRNQGPIEGSDYTASIFGAADLNAATNGEADGSDNLHYVVDREEIDEWQPRLVQAFNLDSKRGLQVEFPETGPDEYPLNEDQYRNIGTRVIDQMLSPDSRPELEIVANMARESIYSPVAEGLSISSNIDRDLFRATARLDQMGEEHFQTLRDIYNRLAYPNDESGKVVGRRQFEHNIMELLLSQSLGVLGIRDNTENLACPKFQLAADERENIFETFMYLNYAIPFGGHSLFFKEDIDMSLEFAAQAREYIEQNQLD